MRTISAVQAQVGDVVAEPVVNDHGRTLLPKGARLSPAVLSRLEGWGVAELCIEADLLAALDRVFPGGKRMRTMMHIKDIARRHLASLRRG